VRCHARRSSLSEPAGRDIGVGVSGSDFPQTREAFVEWANTHGVPHATVFSAIELAPQAGWLYDGRSVSIADVFDPDFSAATGRSSHVRPNTVRSILWDWVVHYARELNDFRDNPASPAIVELRFQQFLERLEAWRAPALTWFPRLANEEFKARISIGTSGIHVGLPIAEKLPTGLMRPMVLFPYEEHLSPSCSCRRTHCWHGSAAVDAFARWLQTGPSYSLGELQRHLRPGHEKVFEALAVAPPAPPPPALTRVCFRIDLSRLTGYDAYKAVEVLADSGKPKMKAIKARDALRAAALLSVKDRLVIERIVEVHRSAAGEGTLARLLRGLAGHSNVLIRENRTDVTAEVRLAPVQIEVVERPGGVEARPRLNGAPLGRHEASGWIHGDAGALAIEPDVENRILWLGELPASAWGFVKALGDYGGSFPAHMAPKLMKTLEGLGPVSLALPASLSARHRGVARRAAEGARDPRTRPVAVAEPVGRAAAGRAASASGRRSGVAGLVEKRRADPHHP
jgi:hypothetical protein